MLANLLKSTPKKRALQPERELITQHGLPKVVAIVTFSELFFGASKRLACSRKNDNHTECVQVLHFLALSRID